MVRISKPVSELLSKNESLRDIHKGQRCFIIGNGPSLNTQDLTLLKDEINIVVNGFFHHKDAAIINPKYWVIADPLYWTNPGLSLHIDYEKFLESGISTKLFSPVAAFSEFTRIMTSKKIDLHYYGFDINIPIENKIDFTKTIPGLAQNVAIISLMLAFYLGCNPIYLLGCDHDFMKFNELQFRNNQVSHFYKEYNKYKDSDNMTWEHYKYSVRVVHNQYDKINKHAKIWNYEIYNATNGGYLEHFPRVRYEDIV